MGRGHSGQTHPDDPGLSLLPDAEYHLVFVAEMMGWVQSVSVDRSVDVAKKVFVGRLATIHPLPSDISLLHAGEVLSGLARSLARSPDPDRPRGHLLYLLLSSLSALALGERRERRRQRESLPVSHLRVPVSQIVSPRATDDKNHKMLRALGSSEAPDRGPGSLDRRKMESILFPACTWGS